jgi:CRISPR-associated protein Csd2
MSMAITNRYDFVLLFDVRDGNPNGDPDAGNLPRVDSETGRGLVTDVSLKRKVRNYVGIVKGDQPPYEIYVKEKAVLNRQHERAYQALGLKSESKKLPKDAEKAREIVAWMCHNFYDIRTFGAVMATEVNSGQVRGPVQLTFARSIDPIVSQEHAITRMAVTNERDLEKERTIGRKHTVPYGLYVAHGFVSAFIARQSGFSEEDLDLLWDALTNMFEHDRSAARGEMATRGLYVFRHESELGNAPAYSLFSRITAALRDGTTVPREFTDYEVRVSTEALPSGVTLERQVG